MHVVVVSLPPLAGVGGGSGGGRWIGGTLKKGREDRNSAVRPGRSHRSRGRKGVGWEGQENTWDVVWGAVWQEGQLGSSARPILSL